MKYDDASWHYGGTFPAESPQEYGGTHIGLFLRWCFTQGWTGELHLEEEPEEVQNVIAGTMTGTEFLFTYCDGKLTDEDFNEEGNAFARVYYGEAGSYLEDYASAFGDLMYVSPESDHDFAEYSAMMEAQRSKSAHAGDEAPDTGDNTGPSRTAEKKRPWFKLWG